jgi:hypothetical protein
VCVFANGVEAKEALDAGAEVIGAEDLVAKIQAGNVDFDTVIATPEMMSIVGKLGKVYDPITDNVISFLISISCYVSHLLDIGSQRHDAQP